MNRGEFIKFVQDLKGATFVTVTMVTKLKMNKNGIVNGVKTPNPYFDQVTKKQTCNAIINFDYEAGVNRLRDKLTGSEPGTSQFKAGKHPWSTTEKPIVKTGKNNSIIERDGKFYLQMRPQTWLEKDLIYQGKFIDEKVLAPFMPPKKVTTSPDEAKNIIISVNVDNIKKVVFKGSHIFEQKLKNLIKKLINN